MFGRSPAADTSAASDVLKNRIDELKSSNETVEQVKMPDGPLAMPDKLRRRVSGAEQAEVVVEQRSEEASRRQPQDPYQSGVKETVISSDLIIQGSVSSKGTVRLQGTILGDMHCSSLIVEEDGSITGNISAEKVNVHGRVEGTVRGTNVMLHSSAFVEGDIYHQGIGIEMGTHYDGRLQWDKSSEFADQGVDNAVNQQHGSQRDIYAEAAE